jgi:hypothetical protein
MAMRRAAQVLFAGGFLGLALYVLVRAIAPAGPTVLLEGPRTVEISLQELRGLPYLEREGSYQNQYGNWRDHGVYRGVPLPELFRRFLPEVEVEGATVIGADGYQVEFPRERLFDPTYPVVLAYRQNGLEPPAWTDGPRIAVLPEDGGVSNAEYGVGSAGSFWVSKVVRIVAHTPT